MRVVVKPLEYELLTAAPFDEFERAGADGMFSEVPSVSL